MASTTTTVYRRPTNTLITDIEYGTETPARMDSYDSEVTTANNVQRPPSLKSRIRGEGKRIPSTFQSLKNTCTHSILNVLFLLLPISWAFHFVGEEKIDVRITFALTFLAIIPLENTFDWLAEQMTIYVGDEVGELLEVTLNNAVEAALAIFLLTKGRLRLLQATVMGVLLLHLLLIPGTSFLTGGARIWEQHMTEHTTELNHSLLIIGVMTLVLPAAFFAALDRGTLSDLTQVVTQLNSTAPSEASAQAQIPLLSDKRRGDFLMFSRALAIILLGVYICSRIFLHNPPHEGNPLLTEKPPPVARRRKSEELERADPKVNQAVAVGVLIVTVALMAATAEWLVDSIEGVLAINTIGEEWFGLILLPLLSFAGDGLLAVVFFTKKLLFMAPERPETFSRGLAIDLSIQFILFWLPFFVLLGWWINKPLVLLFDFFEVATVVAACFLVNYVTADAKTNWAEGVIMIAFYIMIAIVAWFYPGQVELRDFVTDMAGGVAGAVANGAPE